MAKFRNVSVKFWSDPFVESLTPEKRYFFLYLITNEHTTQCGIYEISKRQMAFETGYNEETIVKLIDFFEKSGKIKYSKKTNEVAIKNFVKHNPQGSPKVKSFVEKEMKLVKDSLLIGYIYGIDTVLQEEQEEEQEQKEEKNGAAEPLTPKLTVDERKKMFGEKCAIHLDEFGQVMLREFFNYWTEISDGGRKMRFEKEKTWELHKRLLKWKENSIKFSKNGKSGQQTDNHTKNTLDLMEGFKRRNADIFEGGQV